MPSMSQTLPNVNYLCFRIATGTLHVAKIAACPKRIIMFEKSSKFDYTAISKLLSFLTKASKIKLQISLFFGRYGSAGCYF